MLDELYCRIVSIIDCLQGNEGHYLVFDDNKNFYHRGRKYKANQSTIKSGNVFTGNGWILDDIKNGVRFYLKKR